MTQRNEERKMLLNPDFWFRVLSNFGVPSVIVLAGGWWFAVYVATPLVQSHIDMTSKLTRNDEKQACILDAMQKDNTIKLRILEQNHDMISSVLQASTATEKMMERAGELMKDVPLDRKEQLRILNELLATVKEKKGF